MKDIHCTIGILAYNSSADLPRCLASVKDFAEVIVADGGSTDDTCKIAAASGAHVMQQSSPGHPITDFALERNRLLEAATEPWFFYLDSDEVMSPELVAFIRGISNAENPYDAYRVRYLKTSADASKVYRTYKEYYQVRFVRTGIGAHFIKPIHERIELPSTARVGECEAPWYVPIQEDDMGLGNFARKVWRRTRIEAAAQPRLGFFALLNAVLLTPLIRTGKSLFKIVAVWLRWGSAGIPARYELLRILAHWIAAYQHLRRALYA
jgi:glycosyltransferase involved in cell wall biosynthesis